MIDPAARWRAAGQKPDYAGLLSFGGVPYTEDAADLVGVDVAIVGAPTDDLVSERPGARYGPRAIRTSGRPAGPHIDTGLNPLTSLYVVDFGDAPVVPADPDVSHRAIEATVSEVVRAGAIPIVLGGDHSITEPNVRACKQNLEPLGLLHLDAHADTYPTVMGLRHSHGTVMYRLVKAGLVDPQRYVQVGLRGYSPSRAVLDWQVKKGITTITMAEVRHRGLEWTLERTLQLLGERPIFLTIDIDVLDPAVAPGTGTPEPGGMSAHLLLSIVRRCTASLNVIGVDVVEVSPRAEGCVDVTALIADRVVREVLTGVALRRRLNTPVQA